jgi:uncharacterized protein
MRKADDCTGILPSIDISCLYATGRAADHCRLVAGDPDRHFGRNLKNISSRGYPLKKRRIAVIGSGISGLSAAWLLSQRHDVCLYEADSRIGGHANTVVCRGPDGDVAVDTGFIVYNEAAYPNLVELFDYLDVPTAATEMGFAVSLDGGRIEYAGRGMAQIIGASRNLFDPEHWRMLLGIARFFRTALGRAELLADDVSLAAFLSAEGYGPAFIKRHLLPMAGAIWSSAPEQMLNYPARSFLRFFDNHGLLQIRNRPKWRTVVGGSREYVWRLIDDSQIKIAMGQKVLRVMRHPSHVTIICADGEQQDHDHVVIATHADQALNLLDDATPDERALLSAFGYSMNRAVLHRDSRLMPQRRRLWSSWNYIGTAGAPQCAITYWMNALQPLATAADYFVTLNPAIEPEANSVLKSFDYAHPIYDGRALSAQRHLWDLQGRQNTWFCGAYFGSGFHEDGLQAGLAVAEALGGVLRPWSVPDPSNRIFTKPLDYLYAGPYVEAAE